MMTKVSQDLPSHQELIAIIDQSRQETITTQLRLEQQVQKAELRFLNESIQRDRLSRQLTDQTNRAEQLQLELTAEQKKLEDLTQQIQVIQQEKHALQGALDHEKAIKEDLERRLKLTEDRVKMLNQQLAQLMRASLLQNQLAESSRKYRELQHRALVKAFPLRLTSQVGVSSAGGVVGFMVGGPIGSVIGAMVGVISSTVATQDLMKD